MHNYLKMWSSPYNRPQRARGNAKIIISFFDDGAGYGWMVNATTRPINPRKWPETNCIESWVSSRASVNRCENLATDPLTVQPVNTRYIYYHSSSINLSQPNGNFVIDASNPWIKVIMTVGLMPESTNTWSQFAWTPVVLFFARLGKAVPWAQSIIWNRNSCNPCFLLSSVVSWVLLITFAIPCYCRCDLESVVFAWEIGF
jgi:hypothetical protein